MQHDCLLIVFQLTRLGPCNQCTEETPVFSEEGKLLVQIGRDVFVSVREERDVVCLGRTLSGLPPFSRIQLEVRHPTGLRALSSAVQFGWLVQKDVAKIQVFKVDIAATLNSTPDDLATVFRALAHVRDVQLFLPKIPSGSIHLPHKQTVHSIIVESSTLRSLTCPAPPLRCLSITIRLGEQDGIYPVITRLFRNSLTKLRVLRRQEPGATFTMPSPARIVLLGLDVPHLEYLEVRDLATFVS